MDTRDDDPANAGSTPRRALNHDFEAVYNELHAVAHRHRLRWQQDFTLNTTAIVHEAYLRLVPQDLEDYEGRTHFLCVASKAMRHLLVDYARRRRAIKRGGEWQRDTLIDDLKAASGTITFDDGNAARLVELDASLSALERTNARWAALVECRFFGGMSIAEAAASLGVSPATAKRDWALAKVWLYRKISGKAAGND